MKFYISDLHIGHKKCLTFDNRPFFTLSEMNQAIITNWNSVVTSNDDVYILGDIAWNNTDGYEVISQLTGNKHLIKGNHDHLNKELENCFITVKDYDEIKDMVDGVKTDIILSHYPIAHWNGADYGSVHLYGHIHNARDTRPFNEYKTMMQELGYQYKCYNVGCMLQYMNYTPKTIDEIIKGE